MKDPRTPRRQFLAATAAAPMFLASSAQGANDRLVMALIGSGGRGRNVTGAFVELGAQCAAVCDVYKPNLEKGLAIAGAGARAYADYREILERKDIDAVLIATPDHWHVPMMLDAVQAGKDVYCEKPMSHSISEGNRAIRGVRATDRIVQIGMQRRSTPWVVASSPPSTSACNPGSGAGATDSGAGLHCGTPNQSSICGRRRTRCAGASSGPAASVSSARPGSIQWRWWSNA